MNLYRHKHKIIGDERRFAMFMDKEFENVSISGDKEVYALHGVWSNKKFLCDFHEGEVDEVCTATTRYKLFFWAAVLLAVIGIYGRFNEQLIIRDLCLPAGSVLTALHFHSFFRSHDNPSFFHAQNEITEIISSPYLVRTEVAVSPTTILSMLLAFVCLQPWLFPVENIFMWLAVPNVLIIAVAGVKGEVDQVTARVLVLATITNAIVATALANMTIYSQQGAYADQNEFARSLIGSLEFGFPELRDMILDIYDQALTDPVVTSLLMNILILSLLFSLGKSVFTSLNSSSVDTKPPMFEDNTYLRYTISLILLLNITLFFAIPLSQFLNNPVGPEFSTVQFVAFYAPALIFIFLWSVFSLYSIINERRTLLAYRDSGNIDSDREGTDLVVSDLDDRRAVAVDLIGREKFVLIDSQLYDSLNSDQVDAIYHHELYHVQQEPRGYKILSQIPFIGYVFALFLINPADIYEREIRADRRAAKRMGPTTVKKTLEEVDQETTLKSKSKNEGLRQSQWWQFIKILWRIPLYTMYRPPKEDRIARLEALIESNSE